MTKPLQRPNLALCTKGPFVTRDGRKATFVPTPKPLDQRFPYAFDIEGEQFLHCFKEEGQFIALTQSHPWDIFIAPKDPVVTYQNLYQSSISHRTFEHAMSGSNRNRADYRGTIKVSCDPDTNEILSVEVVKQ